MAYNGPDDECDSTFGEAYSPYWIDPMFTAPGPPLAGTKRVAGDSIENSRSAVPGGTDSEPRIPCCYTCPEQPLCETGCDSRPSKRRATGSDLHGTTTCDHPSSNDDHHFLDQCFQEFCQGCDFEDTCTDSCALPCPGEGSCSPVVDCCPGESHCSPAVECCSGDAQCSPEDACWSPHCEPEFDQDECADKCVDPECSKTSVPNVPCFCGKCDAQACPLGDLNNECHQAHSAPTASGTIYCFDNAPCHFQTGDHLSHTKLPAYDSYQCFSNDHVTFEHHNVTIQASSVATPALSPGNYTSLASFSAHSSPALGQSANCFLNIPFDHCHINKSCCHGPSRDCGEYPNAHQNYSDIWDPAGGSLYLNNYGHMSQAMSGLAASQSGSFHGGFPEDMFGFNTTSWTFPESHHPSGFTSPGSEFQSKMDSLTIMTDDSSRPSTALSQHTPLELQASPFSPTLKAENSTDTSGGCVCRWEHSPGNICLQSFPTPEALHKHIKTTHVDPCTRCFCQWTNCASSGKDFKQRSKLSRHLLGHAGHRPYACSFEGCTKMFATNQAKDNHERTHTGDRPYVCEKCGYTTTTHTQLQTHISALHEGKKPFKCRHCDFVCADSSNLSKHERTHQTLRPYRCPHLGCTFKPDCRWENLKRHLRRSGHCPELLNEASEIYKAYRESVRKEIEEFQRRNEDSKTVVDVRRKGIKKE